jgi:metal-dependent amidase/aminoacylase/carboxypeptidase family protein
LLAANANVKRDMLPSMAAEDFACFLERKPGAYIWIGNGNAEGAAMLHNPHYDFNDAVLPLGASYWVRLAESILSKDRAAVGQL